jgi:hypothetical protein
MTLVPAFVTPVPAFRSELPETGLRPAVQELQTGDAGFVRAQNNHHSSSPIWRR